MIKAKVLLLILILVCAIQVHSQPNYQPFEWVDIEVDGEMLKKVAMLFPVHFNEVSKTYYMQFDTGCNSTFFYGKIMNKHGILDSLDKIEQINFSWIEETKDNRNFSSSASIDWDIDDSIIIDSQEPIHNIIGTIGCDVLNKKIMIIDYPNNRFALLSDTLFLPLSLNKKENYSTMRYYHDRLFVHIMVGEDTLKDLFFDTGSSTTFLLLPLKEWSLVTGKNLDDEGVEKSFTISWGDTLDNFKAPLKDNLKIGNVEIVCPPIDYVDWGDRGSFRLIGNAPFYDSNIVVLDCIRNRFGLYKSVEIIEK